ncbi:hypothetical protein OTK49_21700 [Vibrio coralliirubri]|uniref:hypothetical protein n=1 Tax=Vibrio coralliirubri TaxID=1516159 RepID=UPI002284FD00|nr:hypothetical protein [Vibrio coralliirubri]MCY9865138.1 hypothetical protein [Vibrio coralliirubri]
MKKLLIILASMVPTLALAESGSSQYISAGQVTQSFISLFYVASFIAGGALLLSIISSISDFDKFKQRAENPARQLVVRFVIAGILMSPATSIQIMTETLGLESTKTSKFCFAYTLNPERGESGVKTDGSVRKCYSDSMTSMQSSLKESYSNIDEGELSDFLNGKFMVVVGIFQVIAMYFYLSAWFKIYAISEGKERQSSYGKQVIVLIFSTMFLNLPVVMDATFTWFAEAIK